MAKLVEDRDTWDATVSEGKPVAVQIFGDWCGTCKAMEGPFNEWSEKYPNVSFVRLDYNGFMQDCDDLMDGLSKVPTFQVWQGGAKVETHVGGNAEAVEEMIGKYN